MLLGTIYARYGGAGVLALDNNQTPGPLDWRTEHDPHRLSEPLPESEMLLDTRA
ncbi:hypothetical protein ACF046_04800 [Glutamicibacter creatinolyticus]|uniref:hypothetical protein n=1 Tax=Micrococcaceae TaxID=1268 RepID=UPI000A67B20E|nr:hypothetical protein [Arthrobacter sp. JCM 19049]